MVKLFSLLFTSCFKNFTTVSSVKSSEELSPSEYILHESILTSLRDDFLKKFTIENQYIEGLKGHYQYITNNNFIRDEISFFIQSILMYLNTSQKENFIDHYGFPSFLKEKPLLLYHDFSPFFEKEEISLSKDTLFIFSKHYSKKTISETDLPSLDQQFSNRQIVSLFFTYEKPSSLENFYITLVDQSQDSTIFTSAYPVVLWNRRDMALAYFSLKKDTKFNSLFLYSGSGKDLLFCLSEKEPLSCFKSKNINNYTFIPLRSLNQ